MGAPIGNQNAAKAKRWTAAIERALSRRGIDAQQELDKLAEKFIAAVESGETGAIPGWREFGDRIEGKPTQTIAGDPDAPLGIAAVAVELKKADG
jgi:hypothetical protein